MYIERSLRKILMIRLGDFEFWIDIITVVPFYQICQDAYSNARYLFLIKSIRLVKGWQIFDIRELHSVAKKALNYELQMKVSSSKKDEEEPRKWYHKFTEYLTTYQAGQVTKQTILSSKMTIVYISYKVFYLFCFTLTLSYFLTIGFMLWN